MKFTCPTCGKDIPSDLFVILSHTEKHIIDEIKKKHPDWAETNGICKKCHDFYKKQLHPKG